MMRLNKKSNLSLSINAVVILVLAIAMLGLGLGFTKAMFAKFGAKLEVPPPNIPATEDEPIVLPSDVVKAKIGKDLTFSVNIYNNDINPERVQPTLTCLNNGGGNSPIGDTLMTDFNPQEQANVMFYVPSGDLQFRGLDVCVIEVPFIAKTISRQISLEIS